ncbi:MAG: MerR family transcriptional regulator [Bacteroidia bacterium]|nr:MerR family transcriptional regulator [Bacteroidia bacterium]
MSENPFHEVIEKQYYSIAEVAEMFSESPTVLRFWEKEFTELRPRKGSHGNRMYSHKDIEYVKIIHYLVRQKKYTLSGARDKLATGILEINRTLLLREKLEKIRGSLLEIRNKL